METVRIDWDGAPFDFTHAQRLANSVAEVLVADPICLSWYDRERDLESPAHVNECQRRCNVPGFIDYAQNRGGTLIVEIAEAKFTFCYRPLGEFAES